MRLMLSKYIFSIAGAVAKIIDQMSGSNLIDYDVELTKWTATSTYLWTDEDGNLQSLTDHNDYMQAENWVKVATLTARFGPPIVVDCPIMSLDLKKRLMLYLATMEE
jgi:hypothetical protein